MNSRSDVILPHKKFTWADLGGYIPISPRRYAPGIHPLVHLFTYLLTQLARAYKTGNISETVEDKANATINGLVVHWLSIQSRRKNPRTPGRGASRRLGASCYVYEKKIPVFLIFLKYL